MGKYAKGLAVYFFPEYDRDFIVIGLFNSEEEMMQGGTPHGYTVWDNYKRVDTFDFFQWEHLPTREEVRLFYVNN